MMFSYHMYAWYIMAFNNLVIRNPYFNPQKVVRWEKTSKFFPNDLQIHIQVQCIQTITTYSKGTMKVPLKPDSNYGQ
jgi:hypothetical protein